MKIVEVIVESKFRKTTRLALSNLQSWPDTYNDPYMAYRFGLALAAAPNTHVDIEGPAGPETTTIAYSQADEEIINTAAVHLGMKSRNDTGRGSKEHPQVNTQSVVKATGPITLKSKKK
jgi:hypothetical protein